MRLSEDETRRTVQMEGLLGGVRSSNTPSRLANFYSLALANSNRWV